MLKNKLTPTGMIVNQQLGASLDNKPHHKKEHHQNDCNKIVEYLNRKFGNTINKLTTRTKCKDLKLNYMEVMTNVKL